MPKIPMKPNERHLVYCYVCEKDFDLYLWPMESPLGISTWCPHCGTCITRVIVHLVKSMIRGQVMEFDPDKVAWVHIEPFASQLEPARTLQEIEPVIIPPAKPEESGNANDCKTHEKI